MEARTLNCSSCGAAVSSDAPVCQHCGARLATIACPSCFSMMFRGSKFCPQCGAPAVSWEETPDKIRCPGCECPLLRGEVGGTTLHECEKCFGLWLDRDAFERVCRATAEKSLIPGLADAPPPPPLPEIPKIRYVKCPRCRKLMHRVNFAQTSGVVLDVCRDHGTWFDVNELQRIVQFIRDGGFDKARERQKSELAAERRRAQAARLGAQGGELPGPATYPLAGELLLPQILRSVSHLFGHPKG
jgi:Zn-finger nucleic acid-binding protein